MVNTIVHTGDGGGRIGRLETVGGLVKLEAEACRDEHWGPSLSGSGRRIGTYRGAGTE